MIARRIGRMCATVLLILLVRAPAQVGIATHVPTKMTNAIVATLQE